MTPQILGQTFIGGLYAGGIYALFAVGLTLIYGVMYLINFAHGELLMLGMYTGFWAFTLLGIHPYIAVLLAALLLFVLGAFLERGLFQPVLDAPLLNQNSVIPWHFHRPDGASPVLFWRATAQRNPTILQQLNPGLRVDL